MPKKEKRIDEIRRLCKESGLSLSEVFRKANKSYSTVTNWDRKEPEQFKTYDALIDAIKVLKSAKKSEQESISEPENAAKN